MAYEAIAELQSHVSSEVQVASDKFTWVVVAIWIIAMFDVFLLVAGIFTTGRCREWCCRPPPTRRAHGKCSCRRCCRLSYSLTSAIVFFVLMVIVVVTALFAMASLGILSAKKMGDLVCDQLPNLTTDFVLQLSTYVEWGACLLPSTPLGVDPGPELAPLCLVAHAVDV